MLPSQETIKWAAEFFGIPEEDVLWYNAGTCYDRIGVATKESADKVSKKVEGGAVNGGMLHGMPLGGQAFRPKSNENEKDYYDVTC